LIYLYSKNNQTDKVLETARKLETTIPTSEWAQVSLFKEHLENNEEKSHKCNEYGFVASQ
jgi:hypothetical protein